MQLGTLSDNTMTSLRAEFAAEERRKAAQRTYDALVRKARTGHVAGGRTFGYDNVRTQSGPVERVINAAEAAVVREIFERSSRGEGLRRIAHRLNAHGAPSPRAQQGRPNGWSASSVREVLYRPLYRGDVVWNGTKKRNEWRERQQQQRQESDRIVVCKPELRIISDELWNAAQVRLTTTRQTYLKATGGLHHGKPPNSMESKYLLPGLVQCAVCGGGIYVDSRSHGRKREFFYRCATFKRKGHTVCANNTQVSMREADAALMEVLQRELLDPAVVRYALARAVEVLTTTPTNAEERRAAIRASGRPRREHSTPDGRDCHRRRAGEPAHRPQGARTRARA